MASVVWYILNNPVQAGLVERAEEYPFAGGPEGPPHIWPAPHQRGLVSARGFPQIEVQLHDDENRHGSAV